MRVKMKGNRNGEVYLLIWMLCGLQYLTGIEHGYLLFRLLLTLNC